MAKKPYFIEGNYSSGTSVVIPKENNNTKAIRTDNMALSIASKLFVQSG